MLGRALLCTVGLFTTWGCAAAQEAALTPDPALAARLAPLVERAMGRGLEAGFQVAVVTDEGRLWSASYGVADADTGRPVEQDTRFYVASTAKAVLALTAASLAHRGELDLDATLDRTFPEGARFHPDYDPASATVRDLLTHTHGLQQGLASFLIAYTGQYTNEQLLDLLPTHPPLPDRSYAYSNFGYDLVGLILAPEEKRGWTRLEREEVFEPLGMTHTTNSPSTLDPARIAMPHELSPDGVVRIRLGKEDANVGAAGGQFTTAHDLALLLLAQLNEGRVAGRQAIPAEVIAETQRLQATQDREIFFYRRHGWGLGWDIGTYDDDTVIARSGGFAGYYSNAAFMPDHGFGVVVLSNGGSASAWLAEIVAGAVYDEMRGREDAGERMDGRLDDLDAAIRRARDQLREVEAGRETLDRPLRPLDDYVGEYGDPSTGRVEIVRVGDRLEFHLGALQSELVPQPAMEDGRIEPFFAQLIDQDDQVRFVIGDDGTVRGLEVRGTPLRFDRLR